MLSKIFTKAAVAFVAALGTKGLAGRLALEIKFRDWKRNYVPLPLSAEDQLDIAIHTREIEENHRAEI